MSHLIAIFKMLGFTALLTLALSAQQSSTENKAPATDENSLRPALVMEQIKFLQGKWHYAETYEKTDLYPKGGQGTGTYIAKAGPGGFSQIVDFKDEGPDGLEVGHEVIAWDPAEKVLKSYVFGNSFPGCVIRTGRWDGKSLIFETNFEYAGTKLHFKSITTSNADGTATIQEKYNTVGGPEQLMFTAKATRE